jgi:hypothetical protein
VNKVKGRVLETRPFFRIDLFMRLLFYAITLENELRFGFLWNALAGNAGNVGIVVSHLKQSSLLGGVPLQFVQVQFGGIARRSCRFVFALNAAFGLVALFLLARVFFLAFGET